MRVFDSSTVISGEASAVAASFDPPATEVHSAVAEVVCAGLHVAASAVEKATPFVAEPGSANSVGSDVAAAMAGVFSQGVIRLGGFIASAGLSKRHFPRDREPSA